MNINSGVSVSFTMDETTIDENIPSGLLSTSLMLSGLGDDGLGSPLNVTITITATKGGMHTHGHKV